MSNVSHHIQRFIDCLRTLWKRKWSFPYILIFSKLQRIQELNFIMNCLTSHTINSVTLHIQYFFGAFHGSFCLYSNIFKTPKDFSHTTYSVPLNIQYLFEVLNGFFCLDSNIFKTTKDFWTEFYNESSDASHYIKCCIECLIYFWRLK